MIKCLQCDNEIPKPRTFKGTIVQKFCNRKCHDAYHNESKKKGRAGEFVKELIELLKKYRFMED